MSARRALSLSTLIVAAACGTTAAGDGGPGDAGSDAGFDAGADGGLDAGGDAGLDAGFDGGFDAGCVAAVGPTDLQYLGECKPPQETAFCLSAQQVFT